MSYVPDYHTPETPKSSGIATASLVFAIIAIVSMCYWTISIPCAIFALVLGISGRRAANRGESGGAGLALAGIICSSIALGIELLGITLWIVGMNLLNSPQIQQQLQQMQQQQMQQMRMQMQMQQQQIQQSTSRAATTRP